MGSFTVIDEAASVDETATIGHHVIIDTGAHVGAGSVIGHGTVIGRNAHIGDGCEIGHYVVIHEGVQIGDTVRIDDGASIGKQPMRAANSAVTRERRQPPTRVGPRSVIGTQAVVYAGCVLGEKVLVADLATIREDVTVGDFTIVGRGVAIECDCTIGKYCKLETNVYITAYSTLEDRVFVAPGTLTSNDNFLGRTEERFKHFKGAIIRRGARLGVGSVILPGKEIEPDAVVAAGALLTKSAEAHTVYAGIPARPIRAVPDDQLLDNQDWEDVKQSG